MIGGIGLAVCTYQIRSEDKETKFFPGTTQGAPAPTTNAPEQPLEIRYEIRCHPPFKPDEDMDPMVDILNTINSDLKDDKVKKSIVVN